MFSIFTRIFILLAALWTLPAHAHELRPAVVTLTSGEQVLELHVDLNLEAALAGISADHEDTSLAPEAAIYDALRALPAEALRAELMTADIAFIRLEVGGAQVDFTLEDIVVPPVGNLELARDSIVTFSAPLPASAPATITWLAAGGPAIIRVDAPDGTAVHSQFLSADEISEAFDLTGVERQGLWSVLVNYGVHGFEHIIPKGLDHILFVVGLFLLAARLRPLLWQITAFTAAHTVTLALGTVGVINLPPSLVEPLIALSITYVCIENIFTKEMRWWRPVVVFLFGLLHGLGFAGVLGDVGLSGEHFVASLIAFNVGVEIGQLTVIAACFLAVGVWFRDKSWYRMAVVIPGSVIIGTIGFYWFLERTVLA